MQISRLRGQSSQGAVLQGDSFKFKLSVFFLSGDLCDLEPPLPISNREVKQVSVDDSDWATDCESRSSPGNQTASGKPGAFCSKKDLRGQSSQEVLEGCHLRECGDPFLFGTNLYRFRVKACLPAGRDVYQMGY